MAGAAAPADNENEEAQEQLSQDDEARLHMSEEEFSLQDDQEVADTTPIDNPFARRERERFAKDFFRSLLMTPSMTTTPPGDNSINNNNNDMDDRVRHSAGIAHRENVEAQRRVLEEPDLRVPVGDGYLHLAQ